MVTAWTKYATGTVENASYSLNKATYEKSFRTTPVKVWTKKPRRTVSEPRQLQPEINNLEARFQNHANYSLK
jgi:hypothetical protein